MYMAKFEVHMNTKYKIQAFVNPAENILYDPAYNIYECFLVLLNILYIWNFFVYQSFSIIASIFKLAFRMRSMQTNGASKNRDYWSSALCI